MKKILAFVLALAMVLGMATVVSAADPKVTVTVEKWTSVKDDTDYVDMKLTTDVEISTIEVTDNALGSDSFTPADLGVTGKFQYVTAVGATNIFVVVYGADGKQLVTYTFEKPADKRVIVNEEVFFAMHGAIMDNKDTVSIDLYNVYKNTITSADWEWMLNNINSMYKDVEMYLRDADGNVSEEPVEGDCDWWKTFSYLNMNFRLVDGTTIFYIKAADIDYTWTKAVCFDIDDGLTYKGYTKADIFAAIRKLSGDTKNPYTFGFSTPSVVPTMTVSYVIPQQWINVYGHKNLALWAYSNVETKCEACGAKHEEFKVLETTTLDAITQTQRIEFTTSEFYRTLVLSKTAAQTADNTNKGDKNPNTGANDIVNVAIVFSVISLAAAGAFVFSKQH